MLLAEGLLRPAVYDEDPALRTRGGDGAVRRAPTSRPRPRPRPAGEVRPRADDDEVILWNGGLWAWLDPLIAIRAVARLARRAPAGASSCSWASRPHPQARTEDARRLAAELDAPVYFNDAWVPYKERGGWLLDADCALSTHVDHLETRFAFRTRLLDCFWAGLPVVCTRGRRAR